jgi:hypothetical protein
MCVQGFGWSSDVSRLLQAACCLEAWSTSVNIYTQQHHFAERLILLSMLSYSQLASFAQHCLPDSGLAANTVAALVRGGLLTDIPSFYRLTQVCM